MTEMALMGENSLYHETKQAIEKHGAFLDDNTRKLCAVPPEDRSPSRLAPENRV